ncbi:MAG: subclass B1 metallo-beta-lactamase [Psychroserpens sp.]|nr:subclass B1 metallo-beta-lactamase [Psychroserpens sp.]
MKNIIFILSIFILSCSKANKLPLKNYESETLKIEKISDNIYMHTSYFESESYGKVPCNGMVYLDGNDALVYDTPTNDKASAELINWIGKRGIKGVIVTHFHTDCLGGLKEFHLNGIESYASNLTIELAKKDNFELPKQGFNGKIEFEIGKNIAYAQFFGQGHTKDNIIGYVPSEKAMFGGCLIKALNSGKGNLADANTNEWSRTVEKIKNEIVGIEVVIPGHGKHGGIELLDFTVELFNEK